MEKQKDSWVYELKDGPEVVYYGIANNPDKKVIELGNPDKKFTHLNVISLALTREAAMKWVQQEVQKHQLAHKGSPPKYHKLKSL